MNQDLLTRFLLPHAGVRGVHVRLHRSWLELLSHADYPPGARRPRTGREARSHSLSS